MPEGESGNGAASDEATSDEATEGRRAATKPWSDPDRRLDRLRDGGRNGWWVWLGLFVGCMGSFWPENGFDWVRFSERNRVLHSVSAVFWLRFVTFFSFVFASFPSWRLRARYSRRIGAARRESLARNNNVRGDRWDRLADSARGERPETRNWRLDRAGKTESLWIGIYAALR